MGSVWYVVCGVAVVAAVVGRLDRRVKAVFASIRAEQVRTNAATEAAISAVQRQLAVGPIPVAVHAERGLRGRRLVIDTGTAVLRLHLYGDVDRSRAGREAGPSGRTPVPAFLTRVVDEPGRGWQVQLAGFAATSTYEGWLLERRDVATDRAADAPTRDRADGAGTDPSTSRRSTSPWGGGG